MAWSMGGMGVGGGGGCVCGGAVGGDEGDDGLINFNHGT
uniref:Uncharacterized protein n=1 Tax=Oryza barthii TaxID=65489 RepID=A0A0D3F2Y0_9ORYZ